MSKIIDLYHFEDLKEGHTFELGSVSLSKDDIIQFARLYDPQEFHLNETAAIPVFGGLAASGWQTVCLFQRLLVANLLKRVVCLGGAGVENLQFVKPSFADGCLAGSVTVAEKRLSKTKPDRGLVKLQCQMIDAAGDVVLTMTATIVIGARA